jgi:hypothetical protein
MNDAAERGALDSPLFDIRQLPGGALHLGRRDRAAPALDGRAADVPREPARLITMAWGERYIDDLLRIALPALLAPGNLPSFVQDFDCVLVIVTEARHFNLIARAPAIVQLLRYVDIRLMPIDDLLSRCYGITLTYALIRGFADLGDAMTETHLLFLNADFVLADGSYRKLAEVIRRGERLVVSPSYCMNLEDTIEALRARRDPPSGALSVPSRELAGMIIAHRHNTVRAKTINQQLFRINRYDQFYYYVDDLTLLARQLPIAVVYMKPERVLAELPTFWDYGVISEYCPTTAACVLADSDDFLMAELRSRSGLRESLHLGWPTIEEIAADLSSFTTIDHRDHGRHTLVLHAGDLPAGIGHGEAELARFVEAVYARLPPPVPYRNHPFWASQFPQFVERQQQSYRDRCAAETARAELMRCDAKAAARDQRLNELRARLLAGAERQGVAEQRLFEKRRWAEKQLSEVDNEYRRRRGMLEQELQPALNDAENVLRVVHGELADLASEVSKLEGQLSGMAQGGQDSGTGRDAPLSLPSERAEQAVGGEGLAGWRPLAWCGTLYRRVFGALPRTTCWHPFHTVLQPLLAALAGSEDAQLIVVAAGGTLSPLIASDHRGATLMLTPDMLGAESYQQALRSRPKFALCLCELPVEDLGRFRAVFEAVRPFLADHARIIVFHNNVAGRDLDGLTYELARGLFPLTGRSSIAFAGSYPGALSAKWFAKSLERFNISRSRAVVRLAATLVMCAPLARLAAFIERRRSPHRFPKRCTSMTMTVELL